MPDHAPDSQRWTPWRAAEKQLFEQDPFAFEERLSTPVVLTANAELLAEAKAQGNELAAKLLAEAAPVLRRDFAGYVQERDPWQDTFALWCLVRHERTLELLHPLAVAIATCYAASIPSSRGFVEGQRFPFHGAPLVSASAQLATALYALGSDLALVAALVAFVQAKRLPSGGWGDASEAADVLTTLVAADLAARIDPGFDPEPTRRLLASLQAEDGLWRALGPEAPWLSGQVLGLWRLFELPFAARFRWPYLPQQNRDHKTHLPFFAYFADLAQLLAALPGLSSCEVELGFIDLVGFRTFNNRYGQDAGDDVLEAFARALESIEAARAIRDGGDEFLVVGAPERPDLHGALDYFRRSWPERFRARFGADVPPVAPRILVGRVRAGRLIGAREELGRAITGLKGSGDAGSDGILVDAGRMLST
jgi:GGDEF domain-containing protein